jgi:phosphatidyl-myo-inositol alpha-mannosyltransferase
MKIGLVCPYNMFQFAGGVQEIVLQLQAHLNARGHHAVIITPRPRAHVDNPPKDMILVGRSAKVNTPFSTMVDFGFEADGDEIQAILDEEQFDVLHFHEPWIPLLSRQILMKSKAVNIATFHAKPPDTVVSKSLLNVVTPYTKSVLKYLHAYTAVSDAAAEYLQSIANVDITLVPNGIDLDKFKPQKRTVGDKKTILYLGRLEKRKGVDYLLKAYELLRLEHDDVQLVIAGSGVKRKSLERYVEQYEIPDVTFTGFVPEDQKPTMMAQADVYCSPAPFGESFGIVLLEAMAVGTPTVAGNNSGYASVMSGRGRVSLVNPKSLDDFAQRLELLLYDEDIRKLWRKWALEEVTEYSFDRIADGYEQVYKEALKVYAKA